MILKMSCDDDVDDFYNKRIKSNQRYMIKHKVKMRFVSE